MTDTKPDLDDTTRCPIAEDCATCGTRDGLAVGTAHTAVGTVCVTLCGDCADTGALQSIPVYTAMLATLAHCEHTGVDLDEAAAAMAGER